MRSARIALVSVALSALIAISGVAYTGLRGRGNIQRERERSVRLNCVAQNKRHDRALRIARGAHERALVNVLVPRQNCAELVRSRVGS